MKFLHHYVAGRFIITLYVFMSIDPSLLFTMATNTTNNLSSDVTVESPGT